MPNVSVEQVDVVIVVTERSQEPITTSKVVLQLYLNKTTQFYLKHFHSSKIDIL